MKIKLFAIAALIAMLGSGSATVRAAREAEAASEESRIEAVRAGARLASQEELLPQASSAGAEVGALRVQLTEKDAEISRMLQNDAVAVVGSGQVFSTPDVVTFSTGVSVMRATAREAIEAANQGAARVVSALKSHGLKAGDIQTEWVTLDRDYHSKSFRSSNHIRAKIRQVSKAGEIIAAAVEASGDDSVMWGISFRREDDFKLMASAREAAMNAARAKAEQYAALAGRKLGRVLSISERNTSGGGLWATGRVALASSVSSVPVEPGEVETEVSVIVVFALE